MAAALALVACGKGNNGASRSGYPGGGVVPGCTNCVAGSRVFLQGAQASHSAIEMNLNLSGTGAIYNPQGDPNKDYVYYQGPVQFYGNAYLNGLCGIRGYVNIQTRQAGSYNVGAFGNVLLEVIQNGVPMIYLPVSSGEVYQGGAGLHMVFTPTYPNGQPCDFHIETY